MYVVSGGFDGREDILGSTEVLAENGNSWTKIENSLLIPVAGLRLVTLDNTVYAFGSGYLLYILFRISCLFAGWETDTEDILSNIYEMDVQHNFKFHSFMKKYRYLFSLSVIKADKFCEEKWEVELWISKKNRPLLSMCLV